MAHKPRLNRFTGFGIPASFQAFTHTSSHDACVSTARSRLHKLAVACVADSACQLATHTHQTDGKANTCPQDTGRQAPSRQAPVYLEPQRCDLKRRQSCQCQPPDPPAQHRSWWCPGPAPPGPRSPGCCPQSQCWSEWPSLWPAAPPPACSVLINSHIHGSSSSTADVSVSVTNIAIGSVSSPVVSCIHAHCLLQILCQCCLDSWTPC